MMKMETKNRTQIIVLVGCILGGIVTGIIITAWGAPQHTILEKLKEEFFLWLFSLWRSVLQLQV